MAQYPPPPNRCYVLERLWFFTVSNGVKQVGILSPHLFDVSMIDLSVNVNKLQIGCLYADTIMNNMVNSHETLTHRVSNDVKKYCPVIFMCG